MCGMRTEWRQNCDCGECLILKNTKKFGIFCENQKIPNILVDLKRLELSTSRMRTERSPKRAGFSDDQYPKKVWSLLKPARFL